MPAVSLHAPVALARRVDGLIPSGVKDLVWEPEWNGYRALVGGGRIYSRNGTNLRPLFPDLTPVLRARLPERRGGGPGHRRPPRPVVDTTRSHAAEHDLD